VLLAGQRQASGTNCIIFSVQSMTEVLLQPLGVVLNVQFT